MNQTARVEENLEVDCFASVAVGDDSSTVFILTVSFNVDDSVEVVQRYQNLHAVREAHDVESARWRILHRWFGSRRWRNVAAVDLVVRVADEVWRTCAERHVIGDGADGRRSADEARRNTLSGSEVADLVVGTVVVALAAFLEFFTASDVGVSNGSRWTVAVVAALSVVAERVLGARVRQFDTFVDIDASEVGLMSESARAHAEAVLRSDVDTVLVFVARIGRGAVTRFRDTEVSTSFEGRRTAAGAIVETDQVSGAVVIDAADLDLHTAHQRISSVARWASAAVSMVLNSADGVDAATVFEAWIDTIGDRSVARLVLRAVVVDGAAWFGRRDPEAFALVGIAFMVGWTSTLVGAGQVDAVGGSSTRCDLDAFVDVDTIVIGCDAESTGTNAEAILTADVNAFLVMSIARVRRCAVVACPEAVVESTLEFRRTATVTIQTQEISRTLELVRASNEFVAVNFRVSGVACGAFALRLVVRRSAACVVTTGVRYEAGVVAFQYGNVASLVVWTVVIGGAFTLGRFAARMVGFSACSWWAYTLEGSDLVVALGAGRARERQLVAFVDVATDAVRHENEASGADAESVMNRSVVYAFLIFGAWIGGGAVVRGEYTEEASLLEGPWAAAVLAETLQIARTLVMVYAASGNGAFNVRVASESARADAFGPVVNASAFGATSTDSGLVTDVVTLFGDPIARFVFFTLIISCATLNSLPTALVVRVSEKTAWTGTLEATGEVVADGAVATGTAAVQTLVDVLAEAVVTDVTFSAVEVLVAFRFRYEIASRQRISRVPGQAVTDRLVIGGVAFRVASADPADEARVLTEAVDARLIERTLAMSSASGYASRGVTDFAVSAFFVASAESVRHLFACNDRISSVARIAGALFAMLYCRAESVSSTNA